MYFIVVFVLGGKKLCSYTEFYSEGNPISKKMKKVAVLQSNYIPWRGYFDIYVRRYKD